MLRVDEVSVSFGGLKALDAVDIDVDASKVTGLIGPNGAGKTTLFNVITGFQRADAGKVLVDGRDVTRSGPKQRARLGLGRTFQRLEIFGSLTVLDNVLVALENGGRRGRQARDQGVALLRRVGLEPSAAAQADVLPTGMARLLELARALACQPKVLLLDEPSSGLDGTESAQLGRLLAELAEEGMAVLLVEHDMDLVMKVCTRIHVLDFGRVISVGTPAEVRTDSAVQAAYLGVAGPGAER